MPGEFGGINNGLGRRNIGQVSTPVEIGKVGDKSKGLSIKPSKNEPTTPPNPTDHLALSYNKITNDLVTAGGEDSKVLDDLKKTGLPKEYLKALASTRKELIQKGALTEKQFSLVLSNLSPDGLKNLLGPMVSRFASPSKKWVRQAMMVSIGQDLENGLSPQKSWKRAQELKQRLNMDYTSVVGAKENTKTIKGWQLLSENSTVSLPEFRRGNNMPANERFNRDRLVAGLNDLQVMTRLQSAESHGAKTYLHIRDQLSTNEKHALFLFGGAAKDVLNIRTHKIFGGKVGAIGDAKQREQARDHGLLALAKELGNARDGKSAYFPTLRDPKEFLSFEEQYKLNMPELLMDDPGELEDPMELKSGFDASTTPFARAQEAKRKLVKAAENDSFESEVSNIRKDYKLPEKTNFISDQRVTPGGLDKIGKTPGAMDGDTANVPGKTNSDNQSYRPSPNPAEDHAYNPNGASSTDPDYYDEIDDMDDDTSYFEDVQKKIEKDHDEQQLKILGSLDEDENQFQNKIKEKKEDKQVLIDGGGGKGETKFAWKIRPKDTNVNKSKAQGQRPQPSIDNSLPNSSSSNTQPTTRAKGGLLDSVGSVGTGKLTKPNQDEFATNISRAAVPETAAPGQALIDAETNRRLRLGCAKIFREKGIPKMLVMQNWASEFLKEFNSHEALTPNRAAKIAQYAERLDRHLAGLEAEEIVQPPADGTKSYQEMRKALRVTTETMKKVEQASGSPSDSSLNSQFASIVPHAGDTYPNATWAELPGGQRGIIAWKDANNTQGSSKTASSKGIVDEEDWVALNEGYMAFPNKAKAPDVLAMLGELNRQITLARKSGGGLPKNYDVGRAAAACKSRVDFLMTQTNNEQEISNLSKLSVALGNLAIKRGQAEVNVGGAHQSVEPNAQRHADYASQHLNINAEVESTLYAGHSVAQKQENPLLKNLLKELIDDIKKPKVGPRANEKIRNDAGAIKLIVDYQAARTGIQNDQQVLERLSKALSKLSKPRDPWEDLADELTLVESHESLAPATSSKPFRIDMDDFNALTAGYLAIANNQEMANKLVGTRGLAELLKQLVSGGIEDKIPEKFNVTDTAESCKMAVDYLVKNTNDKQTSEVLQRLSTALDNLATPNAEPAE